MFDEILNAVKNELSGHPAIAGNVTPEQEDAIHNEIANHLTNTVGTESPGGGLLGSLEQAFTGGGTAANAIEGGLINSLASKFNLSPAISGAISAALPGIIQKFTSGNQQA